MNVEKKCFNLKAIGSHVTHNTITVVTDKTMR